MNNFIDRRAVIEVIDNHTFYDDYDSIDKIDLINAIEALPLAEKRGRWIEDGQGEKFDFGETKVWCVKRVCSECSLMMVQLNIEKEFNYCPNCGAKMEK